MKDSDGDVTHKIRNKLNVIVLSVEELMENLEKEPLDKSCMEELEINLNIVNRLIEESSDKHKNLEIHIKNALYNFRSKKFVQLNNDINTIIDIINYKKTAEKNTKKTRCCQIQ